MSEQEPEDDSAPAQRMQEPALWVDLQVRRAIERGDFDNLPGAGKPLRLPDRHDPDWWVRSLVEREQITGVLPPALALRREDAELDALLDRVATEQGVRRTVEEFNHRVIEARRQLQGGPPVVTATRNVDREVVAWRDRRTERRERQRRDSEHLSPPASAPARHARRPRWWPRRSRRRRAG